MPDTYKLSLSALFSSPSLGRAERLRTFASLNLGFVESLATGLLGATDVIKLFYHADNCLYVGKILKDKTADSIMGHGVQLPDLFDVLPTEIAQREFLYELAARRKLCMKLLAADRQFARTRSAAVQ